MEVQVQTFIGGKKTLLIKIRSDSLPISHLITEYCKEAKVDEHRINLIYQTKVLDPNSIIRDCKLFAESAITAVLKKEPEALTQIKHEPEILKELEYPAPLLPKNDRYFVYCPKHDTGSEVNRAGLRPFCKEDRTSSVLAPDIDNIASWEDVLNPKNSSFECFADQPKCKDVADASIGYYFVCQGDFNKSKWVEKDYETHPEEVAERRNRGICKSYSYCKQSNFAIVDLVDGKDLYCCQTNVKADKMIRFNPCGHIYSIEAASDIFSHVDIRRYLTRNTSSNSKIFGKYLISCPNDRFQCNGAILLSTMKVISPHLYNQINVFTIGLDYSFVNCHAKKHTSGNQRFQLLENVPDAICPTCRARICIVCGNDWGDCAHSTSDKTYVDKITWIMLQTYRKCPSCNGTLNAESHCCPQCEEAVCFFCLSDCYGECEASLTEKTRSEKSAELEQDAIWTLYREYSDDPAIVIKVWEKLVEKNHAKSLWESAKARAQRKSKAI